MNLPPEIEQAVLARNGKREGEEIRFLCPVHDDHHPSARFHTEKKVWYCDACKAKGGWQNLSQRLGLLQQAPVNKTGRIVATYAYSDAAGELLYEVVRKANPKTFVQRRPDGKGGWIWNLKGVERILYRLPRIMAAVQQKALILIVEGEKDADTLVRLGLEATTNSGGAGKWGESYSEALAGARVAILPDNDSAGKKHAQEVAVSLHGTAAEVRIVELPGLPTGGDVSDWIAAQSEGTDVRAELERRVSEAPLFKPKPTNEESSHEDGSCAHQYSESERGLIYLKPSQHGIVPVPLTNFLARIAAEVVHDDGAELRRCLEIEARHRGREHRFIIPSAKFSGLSWVTENLGPTAVVYAGFAVKDHTRAAIQLLSPEVANRTVFTHLGWRRIGDSWCYLHGGGAIGPVGPVQEVEVALPGAIGNYILPEVSSNKPLVTAIRASMGLVDLLPLEITLPLYAALWRSVLGACDFALHLAGQTGTGKTELAALAQQHFGQTMDARHLPGSWSSTGNALEVLAFTAKDALLVVDDFAPEGTSFDLQREHREAARLLRAQGNRSGRGRLRTDGTLRAAKEPRGLVVSTGEDIPAAHSIRARLLVLEVPVGGMNWEALSDCQAAAAAGLFAQALAGFLRWLAPRYEDIRKGLHQRTAELRSQAAAGTLHRRTPSIIAELAAGLETFLAFVRDVGALSEAEAKSFWERGWNALGEAAAKQAEHLTGADPVERFAELLTSAISSGRAHVASADGGQPEHPEVWGWRARTVSAAGSEPADWLPEGNQVGWVKDDDLFLDPDASYRAAQTLAGVGSLSVTPQTLWKRLRECGLLVSTDSHRARNKVRVTLAGARRQVLHLKAEAVMPRKPSQSSHSAQRVEGTGAPGPVLWAGSSPEPQKPSQETVPEEPVLTRANVNPGTVGTVGTVYPMEDPDSASDWGSV